MTHAEEADLFLVAEKARALLALMRKDAAANEANFANILLEEPEVLELEAAIAALDGGVQ